MKSTSEIDWSMTNSEIAEITGQSQSTISMNRRKHAPHTLRPKKASKAKKSKVKWSIVDFANMTDAQIAEKLGVSRMAAYRKRRSLYDTYDVKTIKGKNFMARVKRESSMSEIRIMPNGKDGAKFVEVSDKVEGFINQIAGREK